MSADAHVAHQNLHPFASTIASGVQNPQRWSQTPHAADAVRVPRGDVADTYSHLHAVLATSPAAASSARSRSPYSCPRSFFRTFTPSRSRVAVARASSVEMRRDDSLKNNLKVLPAMLDCSQAQGTTGNWKFSLFETSSSPRVVPERCRCSAHWAPHSATHTYGLSWSWPCIRIGCSARRPPSWPCCRPGTASTGSGTPSASRCSVQDAPHQHPRPKLSTLNSQP